MKPYDYQESLSEQGAQILAEHGAVYFAMEERTGKSLTAIRTAERVSAKRVVIITKAKAAPDWIKLVGVYESDVEFTVTSWHQARKLDHVFDLAIVDEAHALISGYPKPGKICKEARTLVYGLPIVYLSATPHAQSYSQLFHQFALWKSSPWTKYKNFYQWHQMYGRPYTLEINGIDVTQYDRTHEDLVLGTVEHIFISKTRRELGFAQEPEDVLHYIELHEDTKYVYNKLVKDNLVELKAGMLVCDNPSRLRFALHQLEGGTVKIDDVGVVLANSEKVDYILQRWGDSPQLVIMYHYKAELIKLRKYFKQAELLQATSYAEGVDLSMYDNLVIYSQDFSTAKHTQRRARQANKNRSTEIRVHYLLVKGACSDRAYKTVSKNKKNFVDTVFNRI